AARPMLTDREVRSTLGSFGFSGDSVDKVCDVLSGGEKIRLAFARILVNPPNFLLLDEPTTHLDMAACEALQNALADYEGTLVIVSHDVEFVRNVATSIIAMTPPGITRYAGDYDYYKEKSAAMALAALSRLEAPRKETPAAGKKASRHERAEKVRQTAAQRRPLQQKMAAAEKRLDILHADQAAVLETLSSQAAGTDFAQLNQRLAALQKDIAETERAWEDAAEKLQELA
ncbi:ABC-F family ATP-binding cassette domain-containing protein, partial [bacterium]|nr:ABC-F family ATP-binding cassette domain-containing protein [bacterium]